MPETGFTGPVSELNRTTGAYPGSVRTRFSDRKPQSHAYAPLSPVLHYNPGQGDRVGGEALAEVTSFTPKYDVVLAKKAQFTLREQQGYDVFAARGDATSATATADPAKTRYHRQQYRHSC
jgi:hypothetical protein